MMSYFFCGKYSFGILDDSKGQPAIDSFGLINMWLNMRIRFWMCNIGGDTKVMRVVTDCTPKPPGSDRAPRTST